MKIVQNPVLIRTHRVEILGINTGIYLSKDLKQKQAVTFGMYTYLLILKDLPCNSPSISDIKK